MRGVYLRAAITSAHLHPVVSVAFETWLGKMQVYFVREMSLMVWKERVFEALKERLRHNTMKVINAARERNLSNLDDNDAVRSLLKT